MINVCTSLVTKTFFLKKISPTLDVLLVVFLFMSAPFFKIFAKLGGRRLPLSREFLKNIGIYPIRDHYYQPLFTDSKLKKSLNSPRSLPGIDFNVQNQLNLLDSLLFGDELVSMRMADSKADSLEFEFGNGGFESGDAEFLYQIIRYLKPRNIIEVGSGNSTKIANKAVLKNNEDDGILANHICIEPFEMPWLEELGVNVERKMVENCDVSMFDGLGNNDLLFIDSSHIIRPQGDVLFEYLEIIPRLRKGVVVHVHDIFSPRDYLDEWIRRDVRLWNEQYLLEALLTDSRKYEILAALNFLHHEYYSALKKGCPYLDESREPGSFYFRVT